MVGQLLLMDCLHELLIDGAHASEVDGQAQTVTQSKTGGQARSNDIYTATTRFEIKNRVLLSKARRHHVVGLYCHAPAAGWPHRNGRCCQMPGGGGMPRGQRLLVWCCLLA